MAEHVIIRLGRESTIAIPWMIWAEDESCAVNEGIITDAGNLNELTELCHQRKLYVLVSGDCVTYHNVNFPGKINRKNFQALTFLIEDAIATDIDDLHVSILDKQENNISLAVIDRTQIQMWLDWLLDADLKPVTMLPESLALPLDDQCWSAVYFCDKWIIKESATKGMVIENQWLPAILASYENTPVVNCYSQLDDNSTVLGWQQCNIIPAMHLMAKEVLLSKVNILQGIYQPQAEWRKFVKPWYAAIIAVGVCLAIILLNNGILLYQVNKEADEWKVQTVQLYRQLFPAERQVANPRRQMERHLNNSQPEKSQQSFIWFLNALQPILDSFKKVDVYQLHFDEKQSELRLTLRTSDFAEFESLYQALGQRFTVRQSDLKQVTGRAEGTLILKDSK